MWASYVDGISAVLTQLAHRLDGSYGLAIVVLAIAVRLLLLPMTLRASEQAWQRQQAMAALKPELERLRERHGQDPIAHAQATQALYREHGISSGLGSSLLAMLVQIPLGTGAYAAVRAGAAGAGSFLWITKLARPDLWLALIVALLSYAAILLNPAMSAQAKTALQLLPVLISFVMVWHLAAALGLYWAGSGSVNVLQAAMLRQRVRRRMTS